MRVYIPTLNKFLLILILSYVLKLQLIRLLVKISPEYANIVLINPFFVITSTLSITFILLYFYKAADIINFFILASSLIFSFILSFFIAKRINFKNFIQGDHNTIMKSFENSEKLEFFNPKCFYPRKSLPLCDYGEYTDLYLLGATSSFYPSTLNLFLHDLNTITNLQSNFIILLIGIWLMYFFLPVGLYSYSRTFLNFQNSLILTFFFMAWTSNYLHFFFRGTYASFLGLIYSLLIASTLVKNRNNFLTYLCLMSAYFVHPISYIYLIVFVLIRTKKPLNIFYIKFLFNNFSLRNFFLLFILLFLLFNYLFTDILNIIYSYLQPFERKVNLDFYAAYTYFISYFPVSPIYRSPVPLLLILALLSLKNNIMSKFWLPFTVTSILVLSSAAIHILPNSIFLIIARFLSSPILSDTLRISFFFSIFFGLSVIIYIEKYIKTNFYFIILFFIFSFLAFTFLSFVPYFSDSPINIPTTVALQVLKILFFI